MKGIDGDGRTSKDNFSVWQFKGKTRKQYLQTGL
jgi:hypothetical protein